MRCVLIAIALSACSPTLLQQSVAPPGRSARLDEVNGFWSLQYYRLELSEGVALAVTCDLYGPCEHMAVISEDPKIAEVRPASLSALQQVGFTMQQPAAAFVIVGKTPGVTKIHVRTKKKMRDVVVTVIAPPRAPNAQTAVTASR